MAVVEGEVYTIKTYEVTAERKTAENLLNLMKDVLRIGTADWHLIIAAFTSDAAGESRKARRLLSEEQPHLVTPDCQVHQINLIVGDYFKVDKGFLRYSHQATELITWLRSKTYVLALIKQTQHDLKLNQVSVIRPVLTRWTSHYLAFRRLLELKPCLSVIASQEVARSTREDFRKVDWGGPSKK